ncbi:hypothetical protein UVI_02039130 [Ustilaginoidea virens]|uniref:Stress response protein (Ish1) n=1 Tax=Ustilaginoidea virens TaxID=1159556 RepID=A0A1B5L880_USTVR|nr:hypothetical protein UVI_02039130 [Ustilaginoidea virens]
MKYIGLIITAGIAISGTVASSWFPGTKAERWLSDHGIPYPKASDRKDLLMLVQNRWNDAIVEPYKLWETGELSSYLRERGHDVKTSAENSKESLVSQVKANWYETEDAAQQAWVNAKDWILDTWSESQLKAFCDKHGIPGETAAYPGDWLYQTWSESELKAWLDKYGIPVPQPTTRDKLLAAVRRNSRLAYLKAKHEATSASTSAQAAYASLTDVIIDAWSDSKLKEFCDKNNIPVPQGTKENELRALVRKHRADFLGDNIQAKATSALGAATSNARNEFAKATDSVSLAVEDAFNRAIETWSESRLKSYLDARGIPVPHGSTTDSLRAIVRKNSHKAASGRQAWTFDDFSYGNLKAYIQKNGDDTAKKVAAKRDATREELAKAAASAYSSASSAGGDKFASATSYLASATASAQNQAFETWTESELKAFLDSYGVPVPQGSKLEELKALARKHSTYFKYGTSSPTGTVFARLGAAAAQGWRWAIDQLRLGSEVATQEGRNVRKEL